MNIPDISPLAKRVRDINDDPRSTAMDMTEAISREPTLARIVLQMVNSPPWIHARRSQIASVSRSIVMYGLTEMSHVFTAACIKAITTDKVDPDRIALVRDTCLLASDTVSWVHNARGEYTSRGKYVAAMWVRFAERVLAESQGLSEEQASGLGTEVRRRWGLDDVYPGVVEFQTTEYATCDLFDTLFVAEELAMDAVLGQHRPQPKGAGDRFFAAYTRLGLDRSDVDDIWRRMRGGS